MGHKTPQENYTSGAKNTPDHIASRSGKAQKPKTPNINGPCIEVLTDRTKIIQHPNMLLNQKTKSSQHFPFFVQIGRARQELPKPLRDLAVEIAPLRHLFVKDVFWDNLASQVGHEVGALRRFFLKYPENSIPETSEDCDLQEKMYSGEIPSKDDIKIPDNTHHKFQPRWNHFSKNKTNSNIKQTKILGFSGTQYKKLARTSR